MNKKKSISFYIETYGCQMNFADTNDLKNLLKQNNFIELNSIQDNPEIIILNTCSVRESAEERIIGRLGNFKTLKKKYNFILILMGCMAQRVKDEIFKTAPHIDLIVGVHHKALLPSIVSNYIINQKKTSQTVLGNYNFMEASYQKDKPFISYVNVIHGCNQSCSYCIVPYTRGKEISKSSNKIILETKELVKSGVVEVLLLGQNVNSYGKDNNDISFSKLLSKLNDINGLKRIRFLSPHPKDFTKKFVDEISELEKLCKHFHLPLQSGSNNILERMEREYTIEQYISSYEYLRKKNPGCTITTDLIVGFPGETDEDFLETMNVVKNLRFESAFMFRYSKRSFTKAANFKDEIDEDIIKSRLSKLIEVQMDITKDRNQDMLGKSFEVLFESVSKQNENEIFGKTTTDKAVVVEGNTELIGTIKSVKLTSLQGITFKGIIIDR